jgi:tRNA-dihydrouridine synthase 3
VQDGRGARNKGRPGKRRERSGGDSQREAAHQDTIQSTKVPLTQKEETEALDGGKPNAIPRCAFVHNLREYLKHKAADIEGVCPAWQARGVCASGWRCRWLGSHAKEENGELCLVIDQGKKKQYEKKVIKSREDKVKDSKADVGAAGPQDLEKEMPERGFEDPYGEIINLVPMGIKIAIRKNKFSLKKSEEYLEWHKTAKDQQEDRESSKAAFVDTPLKPEEKRKLYIGRETPMLAPLTYVLVYSLFLSALTTR